MNSSCGPPISRSPPSSPRPTSRSCAPSGGAGWAARSRRPSRRRWPPTSPGPRSRSACPSRLARARSSPSGTTGCRKGRCSGSTRRPRPTATTSGTSSGPRSAGSRASRQIRGRPDEPVGSPQPFDVQHAERLVARVVAVRRPAVADDLPRPERDAALPDREARGLRLGRRRGHRAAVQAVRADRRIPAERVALDPHDPLHQPRDIEVRRIPDGHVVAARRRDGPRVVRVEVQPGRYQLGGVVEREGRAQAEGRRGPRPAQGQDRGAARQAGAPGTADGKVAKKPRHGRDDIWREVTRR